MERQLRYTEAIREALDIAMDADPSVFVIGEGVPDPKGIFGTTSGLEQKYGSSRVLDMPLSENGLTGVCIGTCMLGFRPVMTHQRIDFILLALDQIANNAAKWHYMFDGKKSIPLVIRLVVGRGWGQGAQHSQSLQALFAHIPGLKVVMPATAYDAKGLLIASIEDDNPVIFIEHRWLHGISGFVPAGHYTVPLGKGNVVREGKDVTIASTSYMTLEAIRAADMLKSHGIFPDVVDIRSLKPLDADLIVSSVKKTGRLLVLDTGWTFNGFSAEVMAMVAERAFSALRSTPVRIALPDVPTPSTPALANAFYPTHVDVARAVLSMLGRTDVHVTVDMSLPSDIPDASFRGPF